MFRSRAVVFRVKRSVRPFNFMDVITMNNEKQLANTVFNHFAGTHLRWRHHSQCPMLWAYGHVVATSAPSTPALAWRQQRLRWVVALLCGIRHKIIIETTSATRRTRTRHELGASQSNKAIQFSYRIADQMTVLIVFSLLCIFRMMYMKPQAQANCTKQFIRVHTIEQLFRELWRIRHCKFKPVHVHVQ